MEKDPERHYKLIKGEKILLWESDVCPTPWDAESDPRLDLPVFEPPFPPMVVVRHLHDPAYSWDPWWGVHVVHQDDAGKLSIERDSIRPRTKTKKGMKRLLNWVYSRLSLPHLVMDHRLPDVGILSEEMIRAYMNGVSERPGIYALPQRQYGVIYSRNTDGEYRVEDIAFPDRSVTGNSYIEAKQAYLEGCWESRRQFKTMMNAAPVAEIP